MDRFNNLGILHRIMEGPHAPLSLRRLIRACLICCNLKFLERRKFNLPLFDLVLLVVFVLFSHPHHYPGDSGK